MWSDEARFTLLLVRLLRYEQNLLEIASSPPNYVRCRAFTRVDTEDEQKEVAPSSTTK